MILQCPSFTMEEKFYHPLMFIFFLSMFFFWSLSRIAGCGRLYRKSCKSTIEEASRKIMILLELL